MYGNPAGNDPMALPRGPGVDRYAPGTDVYTAVGAHHGMETAVRGVFPEVKKTRGAFSKAPPLTW